ncbi:MAG: DUF4956 domain-containing protein [Breznakia sp.]
MLNALLNTNQNTSVTLTTLLMLIGVAFILGVFISFTYTKTSTSHSQSFAIALVLLPALMCSIVLLIGNNVAGAFSLAGVFSIIRFRSAPGNSKDIVYILFCVAAGLSCGIEVPLFGLILTIVFCIVLLISEKLSYIKHNHKQMHLIILLPENKNQEGIFEDVLDQFTTSYLLQQIRTKDLGSTYELNYIITLKDNINKKVFLDDLRCRNGNLNITLQLMHNQESF